MEKSYLGVMLDCSRNAVMSVEEVKRFILTLKKMGYNCLQLYTEDTYEIEGEPLFGYHRGKYTKAELKELDAFANRNGVELMPCIQTLAHLNQIFRYRKYQNINDTDDILLVDDERTYELIEKMIATCEECFSSRNIHIGMDEAFMIGRGKYYDLHGARNRFNLLLSHLSRVTEIVEKYGFKPMMWSDMFFRIVSGGPYYHKKKIPARVMEKVPENMQLMYWDYYNEDADLVDCMMRHHLDFNRDVWVAGGGWTAKGFESDNRKSIPQTKTFLGSARKHGVNDILITMWGNNGGECSAYAFLPALTYAAECAKGNFDEENARKKFAEMFGENWDDFMLCDLVDEDLKKRQKEGFTLGVKEMLYSDYFLGTFDCGVLGTGEERKAYATLAEKLEVAAKRSKNYGYMFESYAALARVLAVKYDLGYLTREAYERGDKNALAALLSDYETTLENLEKFASSFEKAWIKENKPHGFDVQDIRLGGLIRRTKSCTHRLRAYLNGELERIEELEEPTVDFFTGGEPQKDGVSCEYYNFYNLIATANIL